GGCARPPPRPRPASTGGPWRYRIERLFGLPERIQEPDEVGRCCGKMTDSGGARSSNGPLQSGERADPPAGSEDADAACFGIDLDLGAVRDELHGPDSADHGGNAELAGDDGGVAEGAALFDHE